MKKRISAILICIICLCTCFIPTYAEVNNQNGTGFVKNPVSGFSHPFIQEYEMPIVGLITPPSRVNENPSFITRKNFEIFKDAGFNILVPCYERPTFKEAEVRRGLEYCSDLGIVYFANDASIMCAGSAGANGTIDGYKQVLQDAWYTEYPSFGGVAAKDEPNVKDFDEMAKGSQAMKEVFPDLLFFSTLFPKGANPAQLGVSDDSNNPSTWADYYYYVDSFIQKVQPNLLVYDSYIWHHQGAGRTLSVDTTREHFKVLSCYRNRAKEHGIPFWSTIMTHRRTTLPVDSDYTTKELSWVVNTTLAYGAKGLSYYTYWPTIEGYNDSWLTTPIRDGMVTGTGTPHDAYYKIQELNENVKLIDEYIMPATHLGIMQFGEFKNDLEDIDELTTCGYLKNVSGGDAFIGCFELNGKKLYYVVNNSLTAGITTFQCDFTQKVNVKSISLKRGEKSASGVYSYAFNLSAGEAVLLEVA